MAPLDEALLDRVRAGMRGLKPPGHYDKVYKEECMFSFDSPFSPGGLYVNLKTFQVGGARAAAAMRFACRCRAAQQPGHAHPPLRPLLHARPPLATQPRCSAPGSAP